METRPRDWPSADWRLTAPESFVLRLPRTRSAVEVFKLALRELVLRRALELEQVERAGFLARRRPKTVLQVGTQHVSDPALTPLLGVHSRARVRPELDGVLVEDFAKEARRAFGQSLEGYVNDHVHPSLTARGLLEIEEPAGLRRYRRRRHVRTAAGDAAAAELEEWLRLGNERVVGWTRDAPERALAYTGAAGAAILLMPGLYPDFERIGKRRAPHGDATIGHGWAADFGDFDGMDAGIDAGGSWGGDGGGNGGGGNGGG
jgi:hypothetical protein